MYHISYWHDPKASGEWVAVYCPYSADWLQDLRDMVPSKARIWDRDYRVWLVRPTALPATKVLLARHFGEDTFCPSCKAKEVCLFWSNYTEARLWPQPQIPPPMAPPPPAVPPSPRLSFAASRAARVLGLTPPFGAEEVKTAMRLKLLNGAHPDKGGSQDGFLEVRHAADLLLREFGLRL